MNLRGKGLSLIQYQRCFNNRPASYHGSPVRIRHKLITCSILRVLSVLPTGRFLYHGKRLVSAHESEASTTPCIVACVDDERKTPQRDCLFLCHRRVSRNTERGRSRLCCAVWLVVAAQDQPSRVWYQNTRNWSDIWWLHQRKVDWGPERVGCWARNSYPKIAHFATLARNMQSLSRINAELCIRSLITRSTKVVFKANLGLKVSHSKASERSIAWRCMWVLNVFFPVLRFQGVNLAL